MYFWIFAQYRFNSHILGLRAGSCVEVFNLQRKHGRFGCLEVNTALPHIHPLLALHRRPLVVRRQPSSSLFRPRGPSGRGPAWRTVRGGKESSDIRSSKCIFSISFLQWLKHMTLFLQSFTEWFHMRFLFLRPSLVLMKQIGYVFECLTIISHM